MSLNHTHIPSWLNDKFLFRKLFLLRKLFFIKKSFSHYGQTAEDVAINRFFPKKYKGFFVDVGCFHPIKYNNTYRLYRKGWRGVNIDIDAIKIEGFDMVRPGDVNIRKAVSRQPGMITYWSNGIYSPTVTLERGVAESRQGAKYKYEKRTVAADTLTNIIDGTCYKDRQIDFLSVDTEGHDFIVLSSLDFARYKPRIIAIETELTTLEAVMEDDIYQYLTGMGYSLVNWVGLSLIFQHPAK